MKSLLVGSHEALVDWIVDELRVAVDGNDPIGKACHARIDLGGEGGNAGDRRVLEETGLPRRLDEGIAVGAGNNREDDLRLRALDAANEGKIVGGTQRRVLFRDDRPPRALQVLLRDVKLRVWEDVVVPEQEPVVPAMLARGRGKASLPLEGLLATS